MNLKMTVDMVERDTYVATDRLGNKTVMDTRSGDEKKASSPMEVALSAVGGCVGIDIVSILEKRRKTIKKFQIELLGERRDEHPKSFTDIRCQCIMTSPDVTEEELLKVAEMAVEKYCSVGASLRANIAVSVTVNR